jgi:hypothetical protein
MLFPRRQLSEKPSLDVTREEFLEAVLSEGEFESFLDAEDHHGYFLAGVEYEFKQGKRTASARRYGNHPGEASIYLQTTPTFIPYYDPFLASIVQHLREETSTHRVRLLCREGYRDIDIDRLFTHQGPGWRFVGWFWDDPRRMLILFALIFITTLLRALSVAFSY